MHRSFLLVRLTRSTFPLPRPRTYPSFPNPTASRSIKAKTNENMTTLAVQESGKHGAATIVFLHGLGTSSWMWHDQVTEMEKDYHCLCIDMPGNGESYQLEWISFENTADLIASIIQSSATGGKAHVVGLSLGAYVALHLYANAPQLIESIILSGITTRPLPHGWLCTNLVASCSGTMRSKCLVTLTAKAMNLPDEIIPLFVLDSQRLSSQTIKRVYHEVIYFEYPPNLGKVSDPISAAHTSDTTTTITGHGSNQNEIKNTTAVPQMPPLLIVAGTREASVVLTCLADLPMKLAPDSVNGIIADSSSKRIRAAKVPNVHHGWNGEAPELFNKMIRLWITNHELPPEFMVVV